MAALQRFKQDLNLCFSIFKRIFSWQRPFSEGCGGRFSEKTKKNLSQNYGRWIVGFDEPMTSAFFALKKGAEIGGMIRQLRWAKPWRRKNMTAAS